MAMELSIASVAFRYFSPSTSPFYLVAASGSIALILTCNEDLRLPQWYYVVAPIFLILLLVVMLAFKSRSPFETEETDRQLRFARSFGVSSALLCLVSAALSVDKDELQKYFWLSYGVTLIQALVFVVYTWARSRTKESGDFNYVQLALMTSAFLITGTVCICRLGNLLGPLEPGGVDANVGELWYRYQIILGCAYTLWGLCLGFWVNHLRKLITITIPI